MTRKEFNLGLLVILPFGGFFLSTGCGTISDYVRYFDLAVVALDSALPTILGASNPLEINLSNWANLIAKALNASSTILSSSVNSLTKATSIASLFDQIVLPDIKGVPASISTEIGNVITGVDQFLASLGLTQSGTTQPLAGRVIAPHVATKNINIAVNSTDKNVLTIDQQKLQNIIKATN